MNALIDFGIAMSDLRRMVEAAPAEERAIHFAAAAQEGARWVSRLPKPDVVDALFNIGMCAGIHGTELQDLLAAAFRAETGGQP